MTLMIVSVVVEIVIERDDQVCVGRGRGQACVIENASSVTYPKYDYSARTGRKPPGSGRLGCAWPLDFDSIGKGGNANFVCGRHGGCSGVDAAEFDLRDAVAARRSAYANARLPACDGGVLGPKVKILFT